MGNDLEIIKKIEKKIGMTLRQRALEDIIFIMNQGYATDQFENVIGLNLSALYISDISFLTNLPYLTYLFLGGNHISDISSLKELNALKVLRLELNQITDISPLKELSNLRELSLQKNQITDISPLKELNALTGLHLSNNQITNISPLKELIALTDLHLDNNQITDISPLKELSNLRELSLQKNQITELPKEILQLGMEIKCIYDIEDGVFLNGNPLEIPPIEIVKQGTEAVRNYFKELEKESVRLLQSKLLIVGNGEVGKTTLMKKLLDNNFQVVLGKEPTTHGIKIKPWEMNCYFDAGNGLELEKVKLHFWDFGGQDIYHATHQFFLTKRSLYLLVWEARKEEESRSFEYWLNIIKLLSDNSPVIMIMNKSDVRIKYIDEAAFKEKFKNIAAFFQVSCLTGEGIDKLSR